MTKSKGPPNHFGQTSPTRRRVTQLTPTFPVKKVYKTPTLAPSRRKTNTTLNHTQSISTSENSTLHRSSSRMPSPQSQTLTAGSAAYHLQSSQTADCAHRTAVSTTERLGTEDPAFEDPFNYLDQTEGTAQGGALHIDGHFPDGPQDMPSVDGDDRSISEREGDEILTKEELRKQRHLEAQRRCRQKKADHVKRLESRVDELLDLVREAASLLVKPEESSRNEEDLRFGMRDAHIVLMRAFNNESEGTTSFSTGGGRRRGTQQDL